jgi:hypothetical protein
MIENVENEKPVSKSVPLTPLELFDRFFDIELCSATQFPYEVIKLICSGVKNEKIHFVNNLKTGQYCFLNEDENPCLFIKDSVQRGLFIRIPSSDDSPDKILMYYYSPNKVISVYPTIKAMAEILGALCLCEQEVMIKE